MGTKVEIEFISDGFKQILMSGGVQAAVQSATDKIAAKANGNITDDSVGFASRVWQGSYGGGRWIGSVYTTDHASMVAEAEDKALTKAVK